MHSNLYHQVLIEFQRENANYSAVIQILRAYHVDQRKNATSMINSSTEFHFCLQHENRGRCPLCQILNISLRVTSNGSIRGGGGGFAIWPTLWERPCGFRTRKCNIVIVVVRELRPTLIFDVWRNDGIGRERRGWKYPKGCLDLGWRVGSPCPGARGRRNRN